VAQVPSKPKEDEVDRLVLESNPFALALKEASFPTVEELQYKRIMAKSEVKHVVKNMTTKKVASKAKKGSQTQSIQKKPNPSTTQVSQKEKNAKKPQDKTKIVAKKNQEKSKGAPQQTQTKKLNRIKKDSLSIFNSQLLIAVLGGVFVVAVSFYFFNRYILSF